MLILDHFQIDNKQMETLILNGVTHIVLLHANQEVYLNVLKNHGFKVVQETENLFIFTKTETI